MILRPYQKTLVEGVWAKHSGGARNVLAILPTGGGKSACFAALTAAWTGAGHRTCILVHRKELLHQASATLRRVGVEHGRIAPGYAMTRDAVHVASVDTLLARMDEMAPILERFDRVVTDESHHIVAGKWSTVRARMPNALGLGVTATPFRADGRGLGDAFDAVVKGPTIAGLTEAGFLTPAVVYQPPAKVDLSKVRSRAGDYLASDLVAAVDRAEVTLPAVEHYRRLLDGKPAIAFCASVDHAKHVAEQFQAGGYRALSIDGGMKDRDRDEAIAGLGNGRLDVLTSCDIVSEGTDIPVVAGAILLRPTQSTGLFLQQIGRCLRPAPGKTEAVVIDVVGNVALHGMPDAERKWTLQGGIKGLERTVPATRRCRYCFVRCEAGPEKCPRCSRSYGLTKPKVAPVAAAPALVSEAPVVLGMLTDAEIRRMPLQAAVRIARNVTELQRIAAARGYKSGWVRHIMLERASHRRRSA